MSVSLKAPVKNLGVTSAGRPNPADTAGAMAPTPKSSPELTPASRLLASIIHLPDDPLIAYAVYSPRQSSTTVTQRNLDLERARRDVLRSNTQKDLLSSIFPHVFISKGSQLIYLFAVRKREEMVPELIWQPFQFEGLTMVEKAEFAPKDIYPCSEQCASQHTPCPTCMSGELSTPRDPATLRPRIPLRRPYMLWLEAFRERIIDDICTTSMRKDRRALIRMQNGFLLGPLPPGSEWGADWEHHAQLRPLVFCELRVSLAQNNLTVQAVLRTTNLLPSRFNLPLTAGTPITLLPHGTPAYFLTEYHGPTSVVTTQFNEALTGMGAGQWRSQTSDGMQNHGFSEPAFIIAWLGVQNKQGEEKGMPIIWPTRLCLSFAPSFAHSIRRQPLSYIPELPAQLQSSPKPAPPSPPAGLGEEKASILSGPSRRPMFLRSRSSSASGSPLRAFRSLNITRTRSVSRVAEDVSRYVDVVAKEREKERERIRREREAAAASPKTGTIALKSGVSPSASKLMIEPAAESSLQSTPGASSLAPDAKETQSQPVYPSPASDSIIAPPDAGESTLLDAPIKIDPSDSAEPGARTPAAASSSSHTFDAFNNIDTWNQPADEFMSMDMDYNMDFGMGLSSSSSIVRGTVGTSKFGTAMDLDFEDGFGAFTDDDFSFFDKPSTTTRVLATTNLGPLDTSSTLHSHASATPFFKDGPISQSGPGPPTSFAPSAWTQKDLPGGFEALSSRQGHRPPDLLPFNPSSETPLSTSEPPTPSVAIDITPSYPVLGPPAPFDAIAFGRSHYLADDKYAMGKFALPSPPAEELIVRSLPSTPSGHLGWRTRYSAATDPRVAVLQQLKRKSVDQGKREPPKPRPRWYREKEEEWEKESSLDVDPDPDSEEDEDETLVNDPKNILSRPSTPPPGYLPLGASLLFTKFQHSQLLPISSALRPPGAAVAPTNLTATAAASASVPTPVSPAAAHGAASERSKSQEAAAQILVKEVVDNPAWCNAWLSSSVDRVEAQSKGKDIWHADIERVMQALQVIGPADNLPQASSVLASSNTEAVQMETIFQPQEPPSVTVGKTDTLVNVGTPALRFWQKLGLVPKGGRKNVTAFVVFEESVPERVEQAREWMKQVTLAYTEHNFGTHIPGLSSSGSDSDGLAPFRYESFKKTLPTFLESLTPKPPRLVMYLIIPQTIMFLSSPTLRHILSAMKRAYKSYTDGQIVFELIPEHLVAGSNEDPYAHRLEIDAVVASVYDRILVPVERMMSRSFFVHSLDLRAVFQKPAFTLARSPAQAKVKLLRQMPSRSLDVVDRYRMLHVGYALSACGKWLFAARIDEGGEEHDVAVWLTQSDGGSAQIVERVWNYSVQFAKRANVEWRVVVAKLGIMTEHDLIAWSRLLSSNVANSDLPIHVSIVSVDHSSTWTFLPTLPSESDTTMVASAATVSGSFFVDASSVTYIINPLDPLPLHLPPGDCPDDGRAAPFILEPDSDENDDTVSSSQSLIRPLSTTLLVRLTPDGPITTNVSTTHVHLLYTVKAPLCSLDPASLPEKQTHEDLTRSFYELSVLARERWHLDSRGAHPSLPFHLAALEVMRAALACEAAPGSSIGEC